MTSKKVIFVVVPPPAPAAGIRQPEGQPPITFPIRNMRLHKPNSMILMVMVVALGAGILSCSTAQAVTDYWDGSGDSSWNTVANWSTTVGGGSTPGAVPGASDNVLFNATAVTNQINTLGAAQQANSLTFRSNATTGIALGTVDDYTLTLHGGGITVEAGSAAHTINSTLSLHDSQTWTNNSANTLTIAGTVRTYDFSTKAAVTVAGTGNITLTNYDVFHGGLTKTGTGTLTYNYSNFFICTGGVNMQEGTLVLNTNHISCPFLQTGGTILAGSTVTLNYVGESSLQGGSFICSGDLEIWYGRTAQITGTADVSAKRLFLNISQGDVAANLDGGTLTLTTGMYQWGAGYPNSGSATINLNGTTVRAGKSGLSSFWQGLDHTYVKAGGAIIDSQNYTGTVIAQAIEHDPALGGTPDGGFAKLGSGDVTLSGSNTFTGSTVISAGTLKVGNNLALQNSALDTSGAGTLAFSSGINTPTFGGLTGSGNLTLPANVTALTLNPGTSVSKNYSGVLGSATAGMTLTKTGLGTQALFGANTYTGATNITSGTLALFGSGSINSTSGITINGPNAAFMQNSSAPCSRAFTLTQGTLGGIGIISTAINAGPNVTIAPGDRTLAAPAAGTLTITNSVNLNYGGSGGSTTEMRLFDNAGATDKLVSTSGSFAFGGALNVTKIGSWTPIAGTTYDLFDWSGTATGTFSSVSLPSVGSGVQWHDFGGGVYFDYTTGQIRLDLATGDWSVITVDNSGSSSATSTTVTLGTSGRVLVGAGAQSGSATLYKTGSATTTYTLINGTGATNSGFSGSFAAGTQTATGTVGLDATTISTAGSKSSTVTVHAGTGADDADDVITVQTIVVNERTFTNPSSIALGRVVMSSAVPSNQSGNVTSTASHGTTANATLATYGGSPINGLTITGGGVLFNGTTTSATYTLSGTVTGTAGSAVGGTFNLNATDEFGNTLNNAASVAFSGTAIANRTFSTGHENSGAALDLGTFHVHGSPASNSITVSTTGDDGACTRVTIGGNNDGLVTVAGSGTVFNSNAQSESRTVTGGTFNSAGVITGNFTLTTAKATSETATGTVNQSTPFYYKASVFSGNARWTSNGDTAWGSALNWTDTSTSNIHAAPGTFGSSFDNVDTATFDGTGSQASIVLGATVALKGLSFSHDGAAVDYTVSGSAITLKSDSGTATVSGTAGNNVIIAPITLASNTVVTVSADTLTFSGTVGGTGVLTKQGAGTLILSGANTYTGAMTVSAGTLQGNTSSVRGNITNNASVVFNQAADGSYAGLMTGTGSLAKTGGGQLTLPEANTFSSSGGITISQGILVAPFGISRSGSPVSVAAVATLEAGGQVNRAISGTGTVTATADLIIGKSTQAGQFNQGSTPGLGGTLNVGGNAVVILSADKAILGSQTNLNEGGSLTTLHGSQLGYATTVDTTKILTATGNATINGDFVNNGIVNGPAGDQWLTFTQDVKGGGNMTGNIKYAGSYSPGNSPASVSVENILFDPTSVLIIEFAGKTLGSEYDQLVISGLATLNGTLDVDLLNSFTPSVGDSFHIFNGTTTGSFAQLSLPVLGSGLSWNTGNLYTTGELSVTPEPASLSLLALGGLAVIRRKRK